MNPFQIRTLDGEVTAKYEGQLEDEGGSGLLLPNGTGSLHVYSHLTRRDITIAEKNITGGG